RFLPRKQRDVDDYPSMNLLIRKIEFESVGGFDSHFWPGEDTKLCLDLTHKRGKRIVYDPAALVYHHHRALFVPHLRQHGRNAVHRVPSPRVLPQTCLRFSYLVPTLFVAGLVAGGLLSLIWPPVRLLYLAVVGLYGLGLALTAAWIFWRERDLAVALLSGA